MLGENFCSRFVSEGLSGIARFQGIVFVNTVVIIVDNTIDLAAIV
jgi:hypothetical protein